MRKNNPSGSAVKNRGAVKNLLALAIAATLSLPAAAAADPLNVGNWTDLKAALEDSSSSGSEIAFSGDILVENETDGSIDVRVPNLVIDGRGHNLAVGENVSFNHFLTAADDLASLTLKNIGTIELDSSGRAVQVARGGGIIPQSESTSGAIKWGTVLSNGAALTLESVAIQNHASVATGGIRFEGKVEAGQLPENGHVLINKSYIANNSSLAEFPTAVWVNFARDLTLKNSTVTGNKGNGNGYAVVSTYTPETNVINSAITDNEGMAAFAVMNVSPYDSIGPASSHYAAQSTVTIKDSVFERNHNTDTQSSDTQSFYCDGGAGLVYFANPSFNQHADVTVSMENTLVKDNSSTGRGGGFMIYGEGDTTVSVTKSRFENNTAGGNGGGLMLDSKGRVEADFTDTDFVGNQGALGKAVTAHGKTGILRFTAETQDMRIAESLRDEEEAPGTYQIYSRELPVEMRAREGRTLTVTGNVAGAGRARKTFDINAEGYEGAVNLYGEVESLKSRLNGGTLGLLGSSKTFKDAGLEVTADAKLNTVNQSLQALEMRSLQFSGDDVTWLWSADVDLAAAEMDRFERIPAVFGNGRILVEHWNVLTDGTADRIVVDASDIPQLEARLGLAESGKKAVWTDDTDPEKKSYWTVRYLGHTDDTSGYPQIVEGGQYEFVRCDPFDDPDVGGGSAIPSSPLPGHFGALMTQASIALGAQTMADQILHDTDTERHWWVRADTEKFDLSAKGLPAADWQATLVTTGVNSQATPVGEKTSVTAGVFVGMARPEMKIGGHRVKTEAESIYAGLRSQLDAGDWRAVGFVAAGYADTTLDDAGEADEGLAWVNAGLGLRRAWLSTGLLDEVSFGLYVDTLRIDDLMLRSGSTGHTRSDALTVTRLHPEAALRKAVAEHWFLDADIAYYRQKAEGEAEAIHLDGTHVDLPAWDDLDYLRVGLSMQYCDNKKAVAFKVKRTEGDVEGWSARLLYEQRF